MCRDKIRQAESLSWSDATAPRACVDTHLRIPTATHVSTAWKLCRDVFAAKPKTAGIGARRHSSCDEHRASIIASPLPPGVATRGDAAGLALGAMAVAAQQPPALVVRSICFSWMAVLCVCVCVRACVRESARAGKRACVRTCFCVCVCVCAHHLLRRPQRAC